MTNKRLKVEDFLQVDPDSSEEQRSLSLDKITLPENQPRRYVDPEDLAELAESIRHHGVLEPILVRPLGDGSYELVAGKRRYLSSLLAEQIEIPVTIRELSGQEALAIALIENLLREELNPLEETESLLELLGLRLGTSPEEAVAALYRLKNAQVRGNVSPQEKAQIEELFAEVGKFSWESFIRTRLPLLKLPDEVRWALRLGKIAYTKARAIAKVEDSQARKALLEEAISQDLSLSQIKQQIKELTPSEPPELTPEQKVENTLKRLKKFKPWSNPKKQKKFERLLAQLEALMSS